MPRRNWVSNKILEDEGILGDVNVSEFAMSFLPLEDDVLSLELGDAFVELYLVGQRRSLALTRTYTPLEEGPHINFRGLESFDAHSATPRLLSTNIGQRR